MSVPSSTAPFEVAQYDRAMKDYTKASVKISTSLAALNIGQNVTRSPTVIEPENVKLDQPQSRSQGCRFRAAPHHLSSNFFVGAGGRR
jgi:hypothetical protein